MNSRNRPSKTTPVVTLSIAEGRCVAAYSLGDWNLLPSFERLRKMLQAIVGSSACLSLPVPTQSDGLLHQTLLQIVKFGAYPHAEELLYETMSCVGEILSRSQLAVSIQYRGLVWTPTGLALAGYCDDEEEVLRVRNEIEETLKAKNLPCEIPYTNDILHTTVLRWVQPPSALLLSALEEEVVRWSECVFGELRIRSWRVGKGSWRMREDEREDYFEVPIYKAICHRGNLSGSVKELENNFGILVQRATQRLSVELDVWYHEKNLWLGHDAPEYKITLDWLASCRRRLVHAKTGETFAYLLQEIGKRALDLHVFYHTTEDYVLTNKGLVICYPGKPLLPGSVCMMPERALSSETDLSNCFAICSDLPFELRKRTAKGEARIY